MNSNCGGCGNSFMRHHADETRCPSCVATIMLTLGDLKTPAAVAAIESIKNEPGWKIAATPAQVVRILNEALKIEPATISDLFAGQVVCGPGLGDHPTIQVMDHEGPTGKYFTIGPLGLINGLFGSHAGWGHIAREVGPDERTISRFMLMSEDDIPSADNP